MTLLRHDDKLVYFAHIPKTGGSSVESALRAAGATPSLHYHDRLGFLRCNLQHMHAALYDTFVPAAFYDYCFAVVRHPISRLVSEYKWRLHLGHVNHPFDAWVRRHLVGLFEEDPYVLDNHIRPQAEFIGETTEVFRFEDGLAAPLDAAAAALGLTDVDTTTHVRSGADLEVEWTKDARTIALDFYARDFEVFSYDPDAEVRHLRLV